MTDTLLKILLIENSQTDAELIKKELCNANGYRLEIKHVTEQKEVITSLTHFFWNVILCSYHLDGFDAYWVITVLDEMNLDIPLILISSIITEDEAKKALSQGASQYISTDKIQQLAPVIKRELQLVTAHDEILKAWTSALEYRDTETEEHSQRVMGLTVRLARLMEIPEPQIVHLKRGALLHDIGKLGIADTILKKEDALTQLEREQMQEHAEIGYLLLKSISFLKHAVDIPHYHHERWNGSGYPFGLEGDSIPLSARIFAVVDVYDAMTSDRHYRKALSQNFVLKYINAQSGILFDPQVVEHFLAMFPQFNEKEVSQ